MSKTKYKIKKGIISALLFTQTFGAAIPVVAVNQNPEEQTPKANVKLTEIFPYKQKPLSRVDLLVTNIPFNSSVYLFKEHNKNTGKDFSRSRIQSVPFNYSVNDNLKLGAGFAGQQLDGTGFKTHSELGLVGQLGITKGDFSANGFARYYPKTNEWNNYASANYGKFFADILFNYTNIKDKGLLRIGVDYNPCKNAFLGIESTFDISKDNASANYIMQESYTGIRAGFKF